MCTYDTILFSVVVINSFSPRTRQRVPVLRSFLSPTLLGFIALAPVRVLPAPPHFYDHALRRQHS